MYKSYILYCRCFCVRKVQSSREEFVYKHCHVAKALFTVASVDAIVIQTVLQYRYKQDFFGETVKQAKKKKLFVQTFKWYYEGNKCMQTKSRYFYFLVLFSAYHTEMSWRKNHRGVRKQVSLRMKNENSVIISEVS